MVHDADQNNLAQLLLQHPLKQEIMPCSLCQTNYRHIVVVKKSNSYLTRKGIGICAPQFVLSPLRALSLSLDV